MILCVDLDDTISNTSRTILKYAFKYNSANYNSQNKMIKIENSGDHYYFARMFGWDRDQLISFFDNCYPQYLNEIKVIKNVSKILKKIKKLNVNIYIVTSRRYSSKADVTKITKDWLEKNDITYDKLFINIKNKGELLKKIQPDYFVDDSIENCMNVDESTKETKVIVMNTVYNRKVNTNYKRISSMTELYKIIKGDVNIERNSN